MRVLLVYICLSIAKILVSNRTRKKITSAEQVQVRRSTCPRRRCLGSSFAVEEGIGGGQRGHSGGADAATLAFAPVVTIGSGCMSDAFFPLLCCSPTGSDRRPRAAAFL